MPDLGKYALEVMSAYAASLTLLALIVLVSLRKGKAARADLARAEAEAGKHG